MPKMKPSAPEHRGEETSITSIIVGLVMIAAIVVAAAALMGGSLSRVENRMANTFDAAARGMGLAVETVTIVGLEGDPVLARDIRAAAMIEPGENMLRADPHAIRARIQSTRRVINVRVHRLWPDQVVIIADPAEPVALYYRNASWAVIDTLGREMDGVLAEDHARLPRLAGAGAAEAAPQLAEALAAYPGLSAEVDFAERIASRRWDLHLMNGQRVRLPLDSELETGLVRLARLSSGAPASRHAAILDLRTEGRTYITPRPAVRGGEA